MGEMPVQRSSGPARGTGPLDEVRATRSALRTRGVRRGLVSALSCLLLGAWTTAWAQAVERGGVALEATRAGLVPADPPSAGHRADLVLAGQFGSGRGQPQSYGNAGAWVVGKGRSTEALEPWDYSIGFAFTVVSDLLANMEYPVRQAGQPAQVSFAIAVDSLRPSSPEFRITDATPRVLVGMDAALRNALLRRVQETLHRLSPPDRRYLVPARVTIPVSVHYSSPTDVFVHEGEPLVR